MYHTTSLNNEPGGKDWHCVEKWGCLLSLLSLSAGLLLEPCYRNNPIYPDKGCSVEEAWMASAPRNGFNLNYLSRKHSCVVGGGEILGLSGINDSLD